MRVEIVQLIDQHDVAFTFAVFEIRCGVAADVNHARLHLVIEALFNFLLRECLPAAFNGGVVIDDAALRGRLLRLVLFDSECDNHGNDHENGKRNEADVDGAELCFPFIHDASPFRFYMMLLGCGFKIALRLDRAEELSDIGYLCQDRHFRQRIQNILPVAASGAATLI